ncbi:hypothetical protein [Acinetobacter johnsonii]|uniref:hypothetical protein n=1 Tax=Acinetobacter johnsonii TaxID=40214 RepID=UPI00148FF631|nr:hypothetical protein [Acinetobacter johnsonii]
MSKTEDIQRSAIKILDYLYFYDIVAMETFSNKKFGRCFKKYAEKNNMAFDKIEV